MEITRNAYSRYTSYINICTQLLGEDKLITSINNEDILTIRKELLTGHQLLGKFQKSRGEKKGRTARTVNVYLSCLSRLFSFAEANNYIDRSPFAGITPLRKSKSDPDPLTAEEYQRFLNCCPGEQIRNL